MSSEPPEPPDESDVSERERERRRLERLVPEIIKRLIETGYEKVTEGYEKVSEGYGRISDGHVRQMVSELRLPKEALNLILSQIDETKNGLYRVTAREIRDFLEHTNISEEVAKVLTTLSFEIKTEVRFIPNDAKSGPPKPDVKASMRVKRDATNGEDQDES